MGNFMEKRYKTAKEMLQLERVLQDSSESEADSYIGKYQRVTTHRKTSEGKVSCDAEKLKKVKHGKLPKTYAHLQAPESIALSVPLQSVRGCSCRAAVWSEGG